MAEAMRTEVKRFLRDLVQFVGIVVVVFWLYFVVAWSITAAMQGRSAPFQDTADALSSVLFYATTWIVPAIAIVALHSGLLGALSKRLPARSSRWLSALLLLPLAAAPIFWPLAEGALLPVTVMILGLLLALYGWRTAYARTQGKTSRVFTSVEWMGWILGIGYVAAMAVVIAGSWLSVLLE